MSWLLQRLSLPARKNHLKNKLGDELLLPALFWVCLLKLTNGNSIRGHRGAYCSQAVTVCSCGFPFFSFSSRKCNEMKLILETCASENENFLRPGIDAKQKPGK